MRRFAAEKAACGNGARDRRQHYTTPHYPALRYTTLPCTTLRSTSLYLPPQPVGTANSTDAICGPSRDAAGATNLDAAAGAADLDAASGLAAAGGGNAAVAAELGGIDFARAIARDV